MPLVQANIAVWKGSLCTNQAKKQKRIYAGTCFCFTSGKNQRIKTEISGSTQPIPNHIQKDLPRLRAKNAEVSGTKKSIPKKNPRIGMKQNYRLRDY